MPGHHGISDPGEVLAAMCYDAGIEVTSLPGPAACITALTLSGLSTRRFAFEAFLPPDKKERKAILEELKNEPAPSSFMRHPITWLVPCRNCTRLLETAE